MSNQNLPRCAAFMAVLFVRSDTIHGKEDSVLGGSGGAGVGDARWWLLFRRAYNVHRLGRGPSAATTPAPWRCKLLARSWFPLLPLEVLNLLVALDVLLVFIMDLLLYLHKRLQLLPQISQSLIHSKEISSRSSADGPA